MGRTEDVSFAFSPFYTNGICTYSDRVQVGESIFGTEMFSVQIPNFFLLEL